ncbi:MAG: glycosyltransferase family 87 protein [Paracoccaceae bacterium]|nr:glycosyltransferase family 87 protein [Paracoccaceae bacterium]
MSNARGFEPPIGLFGVLFLGVLSGLLVAAFSEFVGFDLAPLWIAATLWAEGNPGAIYNTSDPLFTANAPAEFLTVAQRIGYHDVVHAFIYPPIWAALIAPLTKVMSFQAFNSGFLVLNTAAMFMTVWLVWRAAPVMRFSQHAIFAAFLFCMTAICAIAFSGNQIHIVITMLLALTYERLRQDDEVSAGAALALAAALKLYPAILAVLFLANGNYRAFLAFLLVGVGLGLVSVATTGWTLHVELLQQLSVISKTLLLTGSLWDLNSLVVFLVGPEAAGFPTNGVAAEKGFIWLWCGRAAPFLFLGVLVWRMRTNNQIAAHPLFWAYAVLGTAFLGPISWCFHYILPLVAAPVLIAYWPKQLAIGFLAGIAIIGSLPFLSVSNTLIASMPPLQVTGSMGMLALLIAFDRTMFRENLTEPPGAHPAGSQPA